jgi:hypothetical protein
LTAVHPNLSASRIYRFPVLVAVITTGMVVGLTFSLPRALVGYIRNLDGFVTKLTNHTDAVSLFLYTNLNPEVMTALTSAGPGELRAKLDENLLVIVATNRLIYDTNLFENVALSAETQRLLRHNPHGETLTRLNWMLLSDTYTNELYLRAVKPWDKQKVDQLARLRGIKLWRPDETPFKKGVPPKGNEPAKQGDSTKTGENSKKEESSFQLKLEKAFDFQLKQYEQLLDTLQTNFYMQSAFILFALFLLFTREDPIEIPIVGLKLQLSWLYFVVPAALLFLWLRFGFLLDSLIKTRIYGWELFQEWASSPVSRVFLRAGAALFEDSGYMDGWFALFRPADEHLIDPNFRAYCKWFFFPVVFGLLLGANHACILSISHLGYVRLYPKDSTARDLLPLFLRWVPGTMFVLLALSHVLFLLGGPNPNWFQIIVAAIAVMLMFGLTALWRHREQASYDALSSRVHPEITYYSSEHLRKR